MGEGQGYPCWWRNTMMTMMMLNKFELGHHAMEATKNISWVKDDDAVDHSLISRWFKKIISQRCNQHIQQPLPIKKFVFFSCTITREYTQCSQPILWTKLRERRKKYSYWMFQNSEWKHLVHFAHLILIITWLQGIFFIYHIWQLVRCMDVQLFVIFSSYLINKQL